MSPGGGWDRDARLPWLGRILEVRAVAGGVSLILDGGSPVMPTAVARALARSLAEAAAAVDIAGDDLDGEVAG